jgi:hypothetical protein
VGRFYSGQARGALGDVVDHGEAPGESESDFSGAQSVRELEVVASQASEVKRQPITDRLLLDFYLSFRFSQGDPAVQERYFKALISEYRRENSEPTTEDLESVKAKLASLKPPREHAAVYPSRLGDFNNQWKEMQDAFTETSSNRLEDDELLRLGREMAASDIQYQQRKRPNRDRSADPHESFFRTYVLRGTSTRSVTYDSIMEQMRSVYEGGQSVDMEKLEELQVAWEDTHPGQRFYAGPDALAA